MQQNLQFIIIYIICDINFYFIIFYSSQKCSYQTNHIPLNDSKSLTPINLFILYFQLVPIFYKPIFHKRQQLSIPMFVGDTFLTAFDRLSVRSTTSGKTGTILGIIGLIAFIIISFLLFIGPVISYFQGDFIQGIFQISKNEKLQMYSGCQFKLAISFYSKMNGELADHFKLNQVLDAKVAYYTPSGDYFQLTPLPCSNDYFAQMDDKPHEFRPQDCFIVPNGILYSTQLISGYLSIFGFVFHPICTDPFLCVIRGVNATPENRQVIQFLNNHYYILRFTAQYLDQDSSFKQKFYEIYSSEWSGQDTVIPIMYALLQTQKVYLDNSIMPWYNNITKLFATWEGLTQGSALDQNAAQNYGVSTFLALQSIQKIVFREYKKLDWLLGMLGGGIFLLFLIFWVPLNFISSTKQKLQNCYQTTLVRNDMQNVSNADRPKFSILWLFSNLLPFRLQCFSKQDKIMQYSERFIDIAEIVKKLKVAAKNVKAQKQALKFQPRILEINEEQQSQNYQQQELKYEIRAEVLEEIRKTENIPQIYQNNLSMLVLYDNGKNQQTVKNKMHEIMEGEILSKSEGPVFVQRETNKCLDKIKKCGPHVAKILKFFDAFGAKPNLTGNPQNYTGFGCILSLLIACAAILTFALTLANMGITRTYWDQIYRAPQNYNVSSVSGKEFRAALCFHPYAFLLGFLTGQNRVADFQFYQYKRDGQKVTQYYYNVDVGNDNSYFDLPNDLYNDFNMKYCFTPENKINLTVYGDADSQQEAYVGFKATPYCSETPASCEAKKNQTYQKFYDVFNIYPMYIYLPQASYYPDVKKVLITPAYIFLTMYVNYYDINLTKPFEQQIYLDTLETINDYASWIVGDYPAPTKQILSKSHTQTRSHLKSITDSHDPYYRLKISASGKVQRIIFTSYKIDFLFATVGGCFIFFFFFFGCFGKAYNNYRIRVKLAEMMYNQEKQTISGFKYLLTWLRIPCCRQQVIDKIDFDIDCTRIAKNVDAVYRLSAANYKNSVQQELSLIYLKQRIKADEEVIVKNQQSQSEEEEEEDDRFYLDWESKLNSQKVRLTKQGKNSIQNIDESEMQRYNKIQKSQIQARENLQNEPLVQKVPSVRQTQKCRFSNSFDAFNNNSQFTLDGERSIRSVFGGIFCICMFVFICVLTSHFVTIYFSQFHRVSQVRFVDQKSDARKIRLEVGKNFKLALSFYKIDDYRFLDVSNLVKDVGISIIKYQQQKLQGSLIQIQKQKISLEPCTANYLTGFIDPHDDSSNFVDFDKAYCVPDGTILDLYGSADDPIRQYFSLKIYNKYGYNNTLGVAKVKQLLQNYLPRYHISNPTVDYSTKGYLRYSIDEVIKSYVYQTSTSRNYNITMTKNIIKYDTAVNPSNQISSFDSYDINSYEWSQFENAFLDDIDRYNELSFYPEEVFNTYSIKALKVNQVFGIVGGCIAFLFLGLGCIPRSYNQYKMRYMIGNKLYTILGRKKALNRSIRSMKGQKSTIISKKGNEIQQLGQMSELKLMRAWILSIWGFIKTNYNTNDTMRVAALIESRVGKDINIFELMKNLNACENGIRKMNLLQGSELNLCRIYPKQIVSTEEPNFEATENLKKEIKNNPELVDAARVNDFTYSQLNTILQAKEANIRIQEIFKEKWLDRFFNISRTTIASRSMVSRSQYQKSVLEEQKSESKSKQKHKNKNTKTYIDKLEKIEKPQRSQRSQRQQRSQKSHKSNKSQLRKMQKQGNKQISSIANLNQEHLQEKVNDFEYLN